MAIKEALQRHPEVFLELIRNLQSEAQSKKVDEAPEEVEEVNEPVATVVRASSFGWLRGFGFESVTPEKRIRFAFVGV